MDHKGKLNLKTGNSQNRQPMIDKEILMLELADTNWRVFPGNQVGLFNTENLEKRIHFGRDTFKMKAYNYKGEDCNCDTNGKYYLLSGKIHIEFDESYQNGKRELQILEKIPLGLRVKDVIEVNGNNEFILVPSLS